jgi:predicted enzyme related to lactoylglutathione lyase
MKRVTGIGGVFFKSDNPNNLKDWYKNHLGLNVDAYGTTFESRSVDNPEEKTYTQWSVMDRNAETFAQSSKDFIINYRVEDLEMLLVELKKEGVIILDNIETYDYGKFLHIKDSDDNVIELWEPVSNEFEKIVGGNTK